MIGWGENGSAFGCDVTTGAEHRGPPGVVVIPDLIDPNGPFAWALYQGRWGQREVAMFSGPRGPNLGSKWNDPAAVVRELADVDPGRSGARTRSGVNTTDLFCNLSERGSRAFVYFGSHPWAVGLLVVALLGVLGFAVWRVWPSFVEALDVYGNELRTFLGIGIFAVPIGILFNGVPDLGLGRTRRWNGSSSTSTIPTPAN